MTISAQTIDECRRLRVEERLSIPMIAKRFGIAKSTLSLKLRDLPLTDLERLRGRQAAAISLNSYMKNLGSPKALKGSETIARKSHSGLSTQLKGEIAMLKCSLRAAELGWFISRPTTDCRYDAILDDSKSLTRAQVKYCDGVCLKTGAVIVPLRKKGRTYLQSEVDVVLAYIPMIDSIAWLSSQMFHGRPCISLRIGEARNGHTKRMNFVSDLIW